MNQKLISWYRMIVDYTYDLEFFRNRRGKIIYTNLTFGRWTGYKPEDLLEGRIDYKELIVAEDRQTYKDCLKMMKQGKSYNDSEYRICDKNGRIYAVSSSSQPIFDDKKRCIGSRESIRDITQRKQMEDELVKNQTKTQLLAQKLIHLQEYENSRLSQEIHDGLSQIIPAVSYRLSSLIVSVPHEHEELKKDLVEIQTLMDRMSLEVRRTLMGLRPEVLDSLGLVSATISLVTSMSQRFGYKTKIKVDDLNLVKQTDQIHIFRIIQESLINAGKHAHAPTVMVECEKSKGMLYISIKDNGKGYDKNEVMQTIINGHYGRIIMEERAKMIGAIMNIESAEGKGTMIGLEYPYEIKT